MFSKIMVPVDLAHQGRIARAMSVAADLARHWGAEVIYVGATAETPGSVAHNPEEYRGKLDAFAAEAGAAHGQKATGHALVLHDPAAELDGALLGASQDLGADLVVMQSHDPGLTDWVWPGHGGKLAAHAHCSVMVVRD